MNEWCRFPRGRSLSVLLLSSLFIIVSAEAGTASLADSIVFTSSNLPIVFIDTYGQSIPDEPKIEAHMGIIDNGPGVRNNITDSCNGYSGKIGIEIRGSSSQMFPKKQYAVETRDSAGGNLDASLLGLPAENDWVFSAPYNDKSLMRDALMYLIARSTGRYASRAKYFELVLNNEYMGVYVLFEKPKRTKNRQNVTKLGSADTTGDAVTGGYMIKIDKIEGAGTDGWSSAYEPFPGARQRIYYQYHYPKPEDIAPLQKIYIQHAVAVFESLMAAPNYADTLTGYNRLLDVNSAADVFLFNELSKNVDGYRLSAYMYKDRDSKGGKLAFGPIWDYNHGFGNCDYYNASVIPGYQLLFLTTDASFMNNDDFQVPFWWKRILLDSLFRAKAGARWNALRADQFSPGRIHATIDSLVTLLSEAQVRNFQRWPVLGQYVWPNYYIGMTYDDEITYLKNWIAGRIVWIDQQFGTTGVELRGQTAEGYVLAQNYPNPFNPTTTIGYTIGGVVALSGAHSSGVEGRGYTNVRLVVFDLLGREVAILVNEKKMPGGYQAEFDASGLSSGVYFYRLEAGSFVGTKKLLLLR